MSTSVEFAFLCERAFANEHSNPSIIGIFERISFPTFPNAQEIVFAVRLRGQQNESGLLAIALSAPNGDEIFAETGPYQLSQIGLGGGSAFLAIGLKGRFSGPGIHTLRISIGGTTLYTRMFSVENRAQ